MIKPKILTIICVGPDKVKITWQFPPTLENFCDFVFYLERSEAASDFVTVCQFNHSTSFIDTFPAKKLWRSTNYRIRAERIVQPVETWISPIFPMSVPPDLEALEIVRRNDILLKNRRYGTGTPVAFFIRKTLGPNCSCWDVDKKRPTKSTCQECFSTRISGGYFDPIVAWVNLSPPLKQIQLPSFGEMEANEVRLYMNNYPSVNPKDLLFVPSSMTFYSVEHVETTSRREFILRQTVAASFLDRQNIVYKLLDKYPNLISDLQAERSNIKVRDEK